ncbi:MAG: pyridoxamine 5'-phosphate oxidase family protein [Nostocoides sp.]
MGISLDDDELWQFVGQAHTGIVTTLRRDGTPITLPVWHVAIDRRIYLKTFAALSKVGRIRNDPRAAFMVEAGHGWTQLRAVSMQTRAEVIEPGDEEQAARQALGEKYPPDIDVPLDRLPAAARAHYGNDEVIVRLTPVGKTLSWDNSRLHLLPGEPANICDGD